MGVGDKNILNLGGWELVKIKKRGVRGGGGVLKDNTKKDLRLTSS